MVRRTLCWLSIQVRSLPSVWLALLGGGRREGGRGMAGMGGENENEGWGVVGENENEGWGSGRGE